jgi:hypothetical protein
MRGSAPTVMAEPGSTRMVRNLWIVKGTPKRPTRVWRNSAGPGESILIHTATASSSGASSSKPTADIRMSKTRLAKSNAQASKPRTAATTRSTSASLIAVYSGRLTVRSKAFCD